MKAFTRGWAIALVVLQLVLAGCSNDPDNRGLAKLSIDSGTFPMPRELHPQVGFWRRVFAEWSVNQVAIHDDRHLGLVYEVIDSPAGASRAARLDRVRERKAYWMARLQNLEARLAGDGPLTPEEQALAERIRREGGAAALRDPSHRLRAQRGLRERFHRGLEISGRYDRTFREIFREAGLPEDLAYLPHVESSFQAHARSSAGAVGMWQFTRPAARTYMTDHPALDERLDPVASARGAARYLSDAHRRLDDWALALTSYNHGIGGMQRAKRQFGTDFAAIVRDYQHRLFGFASRNFYAEFLAAREVARNATRYFPEGVRYEPPLDWDRVVLSAATPVHVLADRFELEPAALTALNLAWTRAARSGRVDLPAGTHVWLPAGTLARVASAEAAVGAGLALARREDDREGVLR